MRSLRVALVAILSLSTPAVAGQLDRLLDIDGQLDKKDMTLPNGEYAEVYPIDLSVGDRVIIDMESRKLDTYLVLRSPSGQAFENDDVAGDTHASQIDLIADEGGAWMVYATSALGGERGKYSLRVSVDRSGGQPANGQTASGAAALSLGQPVQGSLGPGDDTLTNGEWVDSYTVELQAGTPLVVDMTSSELDPFVGLRSPSGEVDGNDDWEGSSSHSRLEKVVEESGTWEVLATSYQAGEAGAYTLSVSVGDATAAADAGPERVSGALEGGDAQLGSGELVDYLRVEGVAGEHWVLDLRSADFDPFLILHGPDDSQLENDDFEGAGDRSVIDTTLTATGTWTIGITTYKAGEQGRYDFTLRRVDDAATSTGSQHLTGTLAEGDQQLSSGEWADTYSVEGLPGQTLRVDMNGEFDTYLGVTGPSGFRQENDDGDSATNSRIEAILPEAGTYTVVATSYEAGQGGSYSLDIDLGQASSEEAAQRDVSQLSLGDAVGGSLAEGDMTLDSGEYTDGYVLDLEQGQVVSVSLTATDFDPYVAVAFPDDSLLQNDDWEGSSELSRIVFSAPETGRYRVAATSYRAGVTGDYNLVVESSTEPDPAGLHMAGPASGSGPGRTYGVFVGISDYPDDGPGDLDFTADDARLLYQGMQAVGMSPDDGRLLVDADATSDNFIAALSDLSAQVGADDRLVIFYSGHGGRVDSADVEAADPDGYDETLALYDRQLTDDELATLLDDVHGGTVLLVLDSCFSGGFSKDVISRPGRMGLFSSHEDVTSAVATKFRAGGYLARFMVEAIGERRADDDGDHALTALELSQYLYERYRADVKSMPQDKSGAYSDIVMTGQNLGYQQVIVDRGGVGPSRVLFSW